MTLAQPDTQQICLFALEEPTNSCAPTGEIDDGLDAKDAPAPLSPSEEGTIDDGCAAGALIRINDEVRAIRLDEIDPVSQAWHLRRDTAPAGLEEILDAIRTTGFVEPIRVVRNGDRYLVVSGIRRYHAAVQRRAEGGADRISAVVVQDDDPASLLRWTLLDALTRRAPSYLEVGWGLVRLGRMLEANSSTPTTQVALMRYLGLKPKSWKGRISEYLATAEAMPEASTEAAAVAHGCRIGELADQPRSTLRQIRFSDARAHPILLDLVAESVANGRSAGPVVSSARTSLEDAEVLGRVAAAVAQGETASSVLPPAKGSVTPTETSKASIRHRVRAVLSRCVAWCRNVVRTLAARAGL